MQLNADFLVREKSLNCVPTKAYDRVVYIQKCVSLHVFQIGSLRKALQVMRNENLRLKNARMKVRANHRQVINIGKSFHIPKMLFFYDSHFID